MKRVLVVDDEEDMLWMLQRNLNKGMPDVEILSAGSGEEALAVLSDKSVELVITDINMPGMNGLDLLSAIKTTKPLTGVIILTAYGSMSLAIDVLRNGADDFLLKPCKLSDLCDSLHRCIEKMDTLSRIRLNENILPVCCVCGLIRDDTNVKCGQGSWTGVGEYIEKKTDIRVSHSLCPKCYQNELKKNGLSGGLQNSNRVTRWGQEEIRDH